MSGPDESEEEYEMPKPLVPIRSATPQQAMLAIAFVFVIGIAIGFALAQAV